MAKVAGEDECGEDQQGGCGVELYDEFR